MSDRKITVEFNDQIVRQFLLACVVWGAVGMLVGVLIASQLSFWQLNFSTPWLTWSRIRPLHTNAVIFALVGNMMFAGIYYSTQRLVKARLASDFLSDLHFWGWQAIIVSAALTLPLGLTRGQEYGELIWPINVAVVIIWVVFAVNFFWTLARRREPSLYVALWFYIATIVTVAMLYVVNHLSIPTSWTHSYSVFGGVQNALVQWWYGHNAVAFFLTTPILGIMYYFLPKAAERPVYSYRLSVVHFWSLVFVYIWAGPHHLLNTALPGWLQTLGMTFSLMLWAPSWGGMLNGLLTLRGAPFGAAAAMTQPVLHALPGIGLILWWLLGLAALLVYMEKRPAGTQAAQSTTLKWDSPFDRLGSYLGPRHGPLIAFWLRFYARNNRFRAFYGLSLPLVT